MTTTTPRHGRLRLRRTLLQCRSTNFRRQCERRLWHRGVHHDGDIGWQTT